MRRLLSILAGGLLVASLGIGITLAGDGRLSPELQAVRAAVAKYHSVDQALADGYFAASPCESSPAGTMGIHYINPALFGPGLDPQQPEILLYIPRADGSHELVGVEYFAADADQNLATDGDRPSIFGRAFDGPMPGHAPGMPIHYDLHVWVAETNPSGVFAQWNPAIACP
jgi:hypothetical protein